MSASTIQTFTLHTIQNITHIYNLKYFWQYFTLTHTLTETCYRTLEIGLIQVFLDFSGNCPWNFSNAVDFTSFILALFMQSTAFIVLYSIHIYN